jgi:hypothetical protein
MQPAAVVGASADCMRWQRVACRACTAAAAAAAAGEVEDGQRSERVEEVISSGATAAASIIRGVLSSRFVALVTIHNKLWVQFFRAFLLFGGLWGVGICITNRIKSVRKPLINQLKSVRSRETLLTTERGQDDRTV